MFKKISESEFVQEFENLNRKENFTYKALCVLYDYFECFHDDYELNAIDICSEYTECTILQALAVKNLENIEQLHEETVVIEVDIDTIIYKNY